MPINPYYSNSFPLSLPPFPLSLSPFPFTPFSCPTHAQSLSLLSDYFRPHPFLGNLNHPLLPIGRPISNWPAMKLLTSCNTGENRHKGDSNSLVVFWLNTTCLFCWFLIPDFFFANQFTSDIIILVIINLNLSTFCFRICLLLKL